MALRIVGMGLMIAIDVTRDERKEKDDEVLILRNATHVVLVCVCVLMGGADKVLIGLVAAAAFNADVRTPF